MTRCAIVGAHLSALLTAVLLAIAVSLMLPADASRRGVDIQLDDTFFVAAHFHATVVLAACALVATLVAFRYGVINALIITAWALFVIHVISAVLPWLQRGSATPAKPGLVVTTLPSHSGLGYFYIASALAGLLAVLLGLIVSLWRALRGEGRR